MKPDIAAMTMNELAKYAVTLDGWRQPKDVAFADCDAELNDLEYQIDQCSFGASRDFLYSVFEEFCQTFEKLRPPTTPDLTDPATMGCLLAMVRKRHSVTITTEARPMDLTVKYRAIAARGRAESLQWAVYSKWMPTEAHALVAALAKEAS